MKIKERHALISVYNKIDLEKICKSLKQYNIQIISTGSTSKYIKKLGYNCKAISKLTKFKEILDGRVKTLNHKIYTSLLYDRKKKSHIDTFKKINFPSIDFVIVNLYPFAETIKNKKRKKECIEMIDIGGPTLLRSAAKNFDAITTIIDPTDYENLNKNLFKNNGITDLKFRKNMAKKVFEKTSSYDQEIFNWLANKKSTIQLNSFEKRTLKYGENPNQKSFFLQESNKSFFDFKFNGKEISYNNILDLNSGIDCLKEFTEPTCVIIKHNNPCGVASRKTIKAAFIKAYESDSASAFGGIITLNRSVDKYLAKVLSKKFFELIAAPSFTLQAKKILQQKQKLILISTKKVNPDTKQEIKSVVGGYVVQEKNQKKLFKKSLKNVSSFKVSSFILDDLVFALKVCKHVKSNAIVIAKNKQTIGIGAGQMSRSDATDIAIRKRNFNNKKKKFVTASDAFFPFIDNLTKLLKNHCEAIVQPSGSLNDKKIINYAKKNKLPLYFINYRLFKH